MRKWNNVGDRSSSDRTRQAGRLIRRATGVRTKDGLDCRAALVEAWEAHPHDNIGVRTVTGQLLGMVS